MTTTDASQLAYRSQEFCAYLDTRRGLRTRHAEAKMLGLRYPALLRALRRELPEALNATPAELQVLHHILSEQAMDNVNFWFTSQYFAVDQLIQKRPELSDKIRKLPPYLWAALVDALEQVALPGVPVWVDADVSEEHLRAFTQLELIGRQQPAPT